jgi:outer membrane protein, multidrug efflux system
MIKHSIQKEKMPGGRKPAASVSPARLLASLLVMTTLSCSVAVKDVPAPVSLPDTFSASGQTPLPEKWWLAFNDAALNRLIDQAMSENFTLSAVFNRLEQFRAIAKINGAELIPQLNGEFSASERSNSRLSTNNYLFGLAASYELDLWGRIRANIHAAELDANAAREDVDSIAISLTAEIASTWYRLIEQRNQLRLLERQIQINRDNADLVITRFRGGQATAADVFQQNQLLESVIGDRHTVVANIKVLENALAVLIGKAPGTVEIPPQDSFPALPPIPDTGLSAALMQRRPDVRRAYFLVQAADQRIASAIADRFPKLSLSASVNTSAPDLQSVQEVEDALIQEQQQHRLIERLDNQVELSRKATEQIRLRYSYGAMDFLRVLSALLSQQGLERSRLSAQQQLIDFRISLYRALAGGFPIGDTMAKADDYKDNKQHE